MVLHQAAIVPETADAGPTPAYRARSGWPPLAAVGAAISIFSLAALLSFLAGAALMDWVSGRAAAAGDIVRPAMGQAVVMLGAVAVMQAVMIAGTIIAAGWFGSDRARALALVPARGGWRAYVLGLVGLIALAGSAAVIIGFVNPGSLESDMKPFVGLIRSDVWWLCLIVVGIGAPLSEELLFRGFLFSALRQSRLGNVGAALATTAAWTALHASYSAFGLLEVGLIGLYFSYLLVRTGSLWVPIICHGLYNSALVIAIALSPMTP